MGLHISETIVLVALGGNLPSSGNLPTQIVLDGIRALDGGKTELVRVSPLFSTPCFPPCSGPDYINAAAMLSTDLPPADLLEYLHEIEREHGRQRGNRWASRTLDLDLLAYGETVAPDLETFSRWRDLTIKQQGENAPGQLILPHPRLQDRGFVLVPLERVAPDWQHPVSGRTVQQMRQALAPSETDGIVELDICYSLCAE